MPGIIDNPIVTRRYHWHSFHSFDGKMSPSQVVRYAHNHGVRELSLTDHDNIGGLREAEAEARGLKMKFMPGIELSTLFGFKETRPRLIHLLGYGPNIESIEKDREFSLYFKHFDHIQESFLKRLCDASQEEPIRIHTGWRQPIEISFSFKHLQAFKTDGPLSKESLTLLLMHRIRSAFRKKVYMSRKDIRSVFINQNPEAIRELERKNPGMRFVIPEPFRDVCRRQTARLYNSFLYAEDAMRMLNDIGWRAVLAHPADQYKGVDQEELSDCISLGILGIEALYPSVTPRLAQSHITTARIHDLLVTGGNDFHYHDPQVERMPITPELEELGRAIDPIDRILGEK